MKEELTRIESPLLEVDRALLDAEEKTRLFYHLNPVNDEVERKRYMEHPGKGSVPCFEYRPLSFSPRELLGRLEAVEIGPGANEDAGSLLRRKRDELVLTVKLLDARGSPDFLEYSKQLFGVPTPDLVRIAERLLKLPVESASRDIDAVTARRMLEEHVLTYRRRYGDFPCQIILEPHLSSTMYVNGDVIRIKSGTRLSRAALRCDIHHEIDTHVLTHLNGRQQPLGIFGSGLAGGHAFGESLAIFAEIGSGAFFAGRRTGLVARIVAVDRMVRGESFNDIYARLVEQFGMPSGDAYTVCQRVFRGGGFTKDWVYLSRLWDIFCLWARGDDMSRLFLGKVSPEDSGRVERLLMAGMLRPPRYMPGYLERMAVKKDDKKVQALLESGDSGLEGMLVHPF